MKRWVIDTLLAADYLADGIRMRLFVAVAALQVFFAPLWDQYLHGGHPEHKASNHEPVTFVATVIFLITIAVLSAGRLLALTIDDEEAETRGPISIRRMASVAADQCRRYWRLLWMESPAPILAKLGAALCVTLLAFRGATGLTRWCLWKGLNFTENHLVGANFWGAPRHALEWVYFQERGIQKTVDLLAVPVALLAAWAFLRKPLRKNHPAALREPRALAGVDPLVPRRDMRSHQRVSAAFHGDLVHRLLTDLAEWKPARAVCTESSCRDDVAFFLHRKHYRVATEYWIGDGKDRRRVDLMVEDCIPIEMKYALHNKGTGERDRARSQIECYARIWGDAGPVFLFLAATTPEGAEHFGKPAERWNSDLDDAVAPILVLADV